MNLEQRLQDLANKVDSRLVNLRSRIIVIEQQPVGPRVTVGAVAPSTPAVNDLWVDTNP
jgi:hypothetical protein